MKNTIIVASLVATLAGCVTYPTPQQEEALRAEKRAELLAKVEQKWKMHEEEQRRILQAEQDLTQNTVGRILNAEETEKARDLLKNINALSGECLQQEDSGMHLSSRSSIYENPKPLFLLDEPSGKLTLRLTTKITREVLVRHIETVNTTVFSSSFRILQGEPIKDQRFAVCLTTTDTVQVRATTGREVDFRNELTVAAAGKDQAAQLETAFKELVHLYSPK